ncbi:DUF4276 family protein [bacterium]|nr:DUF4276 family protein [bacterium]
MIRVHVICEGQTEETFVKELLSPSFQSKHIYLYPSLIGKPGKKGGVIAFNRLCVDIKNRLLGDTSAYCTTFFDYYGLPPDFSGKPAANNCNTIQEKKDCICSALKEQIASRLCTDNLQQFIPYVQMHEFEGLLFSDPDLFAKGVYAPALSSTLQNIRNQFNSPEDINDNKKTAPSKRIKEIYPSYQKPTDGSLIALKIGLEQIRRECHLFHSWLYELESLA